MLRAVEGGRLARGAARNSGPSSRRFPQPVESPAPTEPDRRPAFDPAGSPNNKSYFWTGRSAPTRRAPPRSSTWRPGVAAGSSTRSTSAIRRSQVQVQALAEHDGHEQLGPNLVVLKVTKIRNGPRPDVVLIFGAVTTLPRTWAAPA
jgi:hypothetical protein